MSEAKHTPGPWSIFAIKTGWIVNEVGGPGYVCTLPCVSHRVEECRANADLIAAAPELLEALQAVCEELEDWNDFEARQVARFAGRFAIAKALGRI